MTKLRTHVHVTDAEGVVHVFGPADEVPDWARALIVNPKAWEAAPEATNASRLAVSAPAKAPAKRAAPRRKAAGDAVHGD